MTQNIEAEKHLIGCMILDNSIIDTASKRLSPDDFAGKDHAGIYQAILTLRGEHKPVDLVTVSDRVKVNPAYIAECSKNIATTANSKHYIEIVAGESIRRKFTKAAEQIIDKCKGAHYDSLLDLKNDIAAMVDIDIKSHTEDKSGIQGIVVKVLDIIAERYERKDNEKMYYGFPWLDKKTGGAHKTDLTILAARPSVGKTAFALQVGLNLAERGNNVLMFSLEMAKEQLIERGISNIASIDMEKIRYPRAMNNEEKEILVAVASEIRNLPMWICDNIFTIEGIRAECRTLKNKDKLDYIVIDYLQLCDTLKKYNTTNDKVSSITRQLKMMAKEFNVPILLLSQLTRTNERDDRKPKLMDLRDSGSIEQDADNVIFLYDPSAGKYQVADANIKEIEIIIAKQRNGKRDIYNKMQFIKSIQRFTEAENEKADIKATLESKASKAVRTPYTNN